MLSLYYNIYCHFLLRAGKYINGVVSVCPQFVRLFLKTIKALRDYGLEAGSSRFACGLFSKGRYVIHTNQRPISLLPIFAKMFERLLFKNMYNYLKQNNLITKNQSGFTPGDSGTNQLLSLVHDIHLAFDDNSCLEVRSVYLDMSKAFDKVWHEGLLHKLKQNGIEGSLLKLLSNYLSNRKQRVVLNGEMSDRPLFIQECPRDKF